MKHSILIATALATITLQASAATGGLTGKVTGITIRDTGTLQHFSVSTASNFPSGTCFRPPVVNLYTFRIPDNATGDKMRAVLLAAQLSQRLVTIHWDDASKDASGICFAKLVGMSNQ